MTKMNQLPQGVTPEDLKRLTLENPTGVYPVRVKKDDKVFVGLFRKPTLVDMSAAASMAHDPMASAELLYNSCKRMVDPEMDSDDEVHFKAITLVGQLFRVLEGEVGEPLVGG